MRMLIQLRFKDGARGVNKLLGLVKVIILEKPSFMRLVLLFLIRGLQGGLFILELMNV